MINQILLRDLSLEEVSVRLVYCCNMRAQIVDLLVTDRTQLAPEPLGVGVEGSFFQITELVLTVDQYNAFSEAAD